MVGHRKKIKISILPINKHSPTIYGWAQKKD